MAHEFKINEEEDLVQIKRVKTSKGIIGLVIKTGLVKTESQANVLLIGFVIVGITGIIFLNINTFGG